MNRRQIGRLAALAWAMPGHLRRVLTPAEAETRLRAQLAGRNERFLTAARRLIYAKPDSPYRLLLENAGWDFQELGRGVAARGLEAVLTDLRDAGVRLTLEEFKGQVPIERPGLRLTTTPGDFDSPVPSRDGIHGTTSGSRSSPTNVMYGWEFIREEAAHELMLAVEHDVLDADGALWYPALPGVAGVHNLLIQLMFGRPPLRWFSQIDPAGPAPTLLDRVAGYGIRCGSRLGGHRSPGPEFADLTQAERVLSWITSVRGRGRSCVVRGFASSMVRLARAAREGNVDLTGVVLFAGGESLTKAKARFIESTGARVFARYVATEPGLIAASCPHRVSTDDMHVYVDRVAVIPGTDGPVGEPQPLLLTTLSPDSGKVLLNTELGDVGVLARRPCPCRFGRMGFDLHLSEVGSQARVTMEGMTVPVTTLHAVIAGLVDEAGGAPDAWQCRTTTDREGMSRLLVAVAPELAPFDAARFVDGFHRRLSAAGPGLNLAAEIWRRAGAVAVVREAPETTGGGKLPGSRPVVTGAGKTAATFHPQLWDKASSGETWVFTRSVDLARDTVRRVAPPNAVILDVGCGPGRLARELAGTTSTVLGVDLDPAMLVHAAGRKPEASAVRPPRYARAAAHALPVRSGSADVVVATSLIGCLEFPGEFLAEALRVLVPGGFLVVTVTNRRSLLLRLNHALPKRRIAAFAAGGPEEYRLCTEAGASRLMQRAGFGVERPAYYNFVLQTGQWVWPGKGVARGLDRTAGSHGSWWGRNFLLIGRKP